MVAPRTLANAEASGTFVDGQEAPETLSKADEAPGPLTREEEKAEGLASAFIEV